MKLISNLYHNILWILPKNVAHKILYYRKTGKKLNLQNPQALDEKIHYLSIYKYREKYGKLADKFEVRNFVKKKGYEEILPKLYGVYKNSNEINYKNLPNQFVLKTNHGSGDVFLCVDKSNFDFKGVNKSLDESLKRNYAKSFLEYHYSYIKPKIICEEYLNDNEHLVPLDYKFYCFNGRVECVLVFSNRENNTKLDYYDCNWNILPYAKKEFSSNKIISKPKNFEKMLKIASDLSKGFQFVRIDLYNINGKIYFGEMTFTPSAGFFYRHTQEALDYFGTLLDVNKVKKE